jgi:hypothetical protein
MDEAFSARMRAAIAAGGRCAAATALISTRIWLMRSEREKSKL